MLPTTVCTCSAETRGQFERQLKSIVRGTKTLEAVLQEDGLKYKAAFEAAVGQSHVRLSCCPHRSAGSTIRGYCHRLCTSQTLTAMQRTLPTACCLLCCLFAPRVGFEKRRR
jgi:hypothetical protein